MEGLIVIKIIFTLRMAHYIYVCIIWKINNQDVMNSGYSLKATSKYVLQLNVLENFGFTIFHEL